MAVTQSLTVDKVSQDFSANTSRVRILWTSTQSGSSWNGYSRTAVYWIRINGGSWVKYTTTCTLPKETTITVLDTTVTVNHASDGTGKIDVSTEMDTGISAGTITLDKSLSLPTIPRATTPTVSPTSQDIGGTVTIGLPRASNDFTHTLWWRIGSSSWHKFAEGKGNSCLWQLPTSMYSLIPAATSAKVELWCDTYNGSTNIGSKTITFTAKVPASVKPGVPTLTVEPVNDNETIASWGSVYVKGYSRLKYVLSNATPGTGSTIVDYEVQISASGETIDAAYSGSSVTNTSKVLSGTSGTVKAWVRDQRGRWSEAAVRTVEIYDYTPPSVTAVDAVRQTTQDSGDIAPNLLPYPYHHTTRTEAGITWTDNGDGTVTANGTATAFVVFSCHQRLQGEANDFICPNGRYFVSGCPEGGGAGRYRIDVGVTKDGAWKSLGTDYGNGVEITVAGDDYGTESANLGFQLQVYNGTTVENLTFHPALRAAGGSTPSQTSTVEVTFSAAISPVGNKNTAKYAVCYRAAGTEAWSVAGTVGVGNYAPKDLKVSFDANPATVYEVCVEATDALRARCSSIVRILAAFQLIHIPGSFDGLGIAQRVTKPETLQVGWPVEIQDQPVADWPIERGAVAMQDNNGKTVGTWHYVKMAGGDVNCWGYATLTDTLSNPDNAMYYGAKHWHPLPSGLIKSLHYCDIGVDGGAILWKGTGSTGGAGGRTQEYYLYSPAKLTTAKTYYVYLLAIGRWK